MAQPRLRARIAAALVAIVFIVTSAVMVFPLVWTVFSSLKTNRELFEDPWGPPSNPRLDNYERAWNFGGLGQAFVNSFIVSVGSVALIALIAPMAAFATTRLEFPLRRLINTLLLAGFFLAPHAVLIPLMVVMKSLGLIDSLLGLVIVNAAWNLSFSILLLRSFFVGVPRSLQDSARIDGLSDFDIYLRIMLPLSVPTILTVVIVNFISVWNNFLFAFIFLRSPDKFTLPIKLLTFTHGKYGSDYVAQNAAVIISSIPTILLYLAFSERIRKGIAVVGGKG